MGAWLMTCMGALQTGGRGWGGGHCGLGYITLHLMLMLMPKPPPACGECVVVCIGWIGSMCAPCCASLASSLTVRFPRLTLACCCCVLWRLGCKCPSCEHSPMCGRRCLIAYAGAWLLVWYLCCDWVCHRHATNVHAPCEVLALLVPLLAKVRRCDTKTHLWAQDSWPQL